MKKGISLIAVWGLVLVLSTAAFAADAAQGDKVNLSGNWYVWISIDDSNYWLMSFNTDSSGYPVMVLAQDGDILNGNFKGRFGELLTKGSVKGRDFEMAGILQENVVTFKGKLEAGKINGVVDMGVHGSGRFMMARE